MRDRDVVSAMLSDDESRNVLSRVILPAWTKGAARQARPVVVIVGGQPGAGKTQVADLVQAVLDRRGGAVRIGSDLYKAAHQHYAELLAVDVRTAGVKVRPDTRRWQAAVEEYVRSHGFDAVVESALADSTEFRTSAGAYRQAGSRVEVVAVATAEAWSQLGILDRFLSEAIDGGGRYVSWENHDTCAKQMLATLAVIEAEQLADRITVVRRDGTVLYDNELMDGTWRRRPAAEKAVAYERSRPWSARETAVFCRELARTDQRLHRELACADRCLAVQRDAERAAALAEPVRRLAQPRRQAPGVDYHRLSADEHRWVFDELIAPSYLNGIISRDDPRAVYVLGQPGAGKLLAARMVRRAMRPGTVHLVGDDFKASHPDYFQLLRDDPRNAGAAIRADYRAWFAEAEAYVRVRRGDVLIEGAPGSVKEFLGSALPFATGGYPVELVVLAVREADSRLATALRYARALQIGGNGRFTSRAGHDQCFRALADVVELAQTHPAITAVTVIRRDGEALLRHEAGGGAPVSWALAAERQRPYTDQEAAQFLRLHHALRLALPQHRRELDEIAALARPLMPARVQPARIDRPHPPVWPLPLLRTAPGYDSLSSFSRAA
ncbi:zeta toxin family protein [Streptomyces sp. HNM0663]|uniref:UDP-N-acetylglucosamine kinase n=1 Tax=Streptomyces chengmaiensis TaxID=3040919 RepID=A0ABT6HZN2_9ACTN|nr:zeta toxin family protein [Streptomyces chengmaiensis]MDH2393880.1 zeta toxin family protein [Streptomyces chengmaiensis]